MKVCFFIFQILLMSPVTGQAKELSTRELNQFVRESEFLSKECAKGPDGKVCSRMKYLKKAREVGKAAIAGNLRKSELEKKLQAQEALSNGKTFSSIHPEGKCKYEDFVVDKLTLFGIMESGGSRYLKFPDSRGGACFNDGRKGKEARIRFCQNGAIVNIETTGGSPISPLTRQEDYIFDSVKGKPCNLVQVAVKIIKGKKVLSEDRLMFPECKAYYDRHISKLKAGFIDVRTPASLDKVFEDETRKLGICMMYGIVPSPLELPDPKSGPVK